MDTATAEAGRITFVNRDFSLTKRLRRLVVGEWSETGLDMCLDDEQHRGGGIMLKYIFAGLLSVPAYPQTRTPVPLAHDFQLQDEIKSFTCKVRVPENFHCAMLFDFDFPTSDNIIASVVGGFLHQLSLILGGTMYTVVYDPPLKRDDKFSDLRKRVHIPARVDGDELIIQWPDGTQAKGRIVGREKVLPDRPRPA